MVTSWANSEGSSRSRRSGFNEINGRHEETRTPDLYRVNFEVNSLNPFPYLAFPHSTDPKTARKWPSFDGELMASLDAPIRLCSQNLLAYIWQRLKPNTDRHLNIVSRYLSRKEKITS